MRVLANGCFDCLHVGHVYHLMLARGIGDHLAVALTIDTHVAKGLGRPVFDWDQRATMLNALRCVDLVFPAITGEQAVRTYKPDIYVKGKEYESYLPEREFVESYGGRVVFIDTPIYSSTKILSGELLRERIRADRERQGQAGLVLRRADH